MKAPFQILLAKHKETRVGSRLLHSAVLHVELVFRSSNKTEPVWNSHTERFTHFNYLLVKEETWFLKIVRVTVRDLPLTSVTRWSSSRLRGLQQEQTDGLPAEETRHGTGEGDEADSEWHQNVMYTHIRAQHRQQHHWLIESMKGFYPVPRVSHMTSSCTLIGSGSSNRTMWLPADTHRWPAEVTDFHAWLHPPAWPPQSCTVPKSDSAQGGAIAALTANNDFVMIPQIETTIYYCDNTTTRDEFQCTRPPSKNETGVFALSETVC